MRPIRVLTEQFTSFYLIRRLSAFELKSEHSNNYLGLLWEIINPMIQIFVYWFVFGGINSRVSKHNNIHGISFLWWMLSGIVLWFFFNQAMMLGTKSIYTRIKMMAKMNFPLSIVPTIVIASKFYQHLILTAIIFIMLQFTKYSVDIHLIQLPYYMFGAVALLLSLNLITSTLATIVRDVTMIVQAILRMLIYLTPFLWDPTNSRVLGWVFKINPLTYLAEGYRSALLGRAGSWYFISQWHYTIYFWCVVIVLFIIGSVLHHKFRDQFVDFA